jgi:hypothetical protein
VIAEEMEADPGWAQFVTYDGDGNPDGVMYERIIVVAMAKIKDLTRRVAELEAV